MNLESLSNEELTNEVERRLENGTLGFSGLFSTNQINHREAWGDAMDWLHDMCNADFPRYNPLRMKMTEAIRRHEGDRVQSRRQV